MTQQAFILRGSGPGLLIRRQQSGGSPVLYIHGATFPSALSVAYRFDERSWMDDLAAQGHDVWAFDFAGYGGSDRYPQMAGPAEGAPAGRAEDAAGQIARVAKHIAQTTGHAALSLIAHSWGSIPAGIFASRHGANVKSLVLFGPIAQREGAPSAAPDQCWRAVSIAQQLARFIQDVPKDHPPVLIEPDLAQWGPAYLASDENAAGRACVRIPNGPAADIAAAWSGRLAYRPEDISMPTLIVRGEWDSVTSDDDAAWLLSRIGHPSKQDVKVSKGTHLMHLEHSREGLFLAVNRFLNEAGR